MKDPAILFYPNDYLGGTFGMSLEEKGAYMELLILQFNRGHMTTHMIGQALGQNVDKLWDAIKSKFILDENGEYYNARFEEEQKKRKAFTDSRKNNIQGVNQYTKNKKKNDGHMDGHVTSHMENENEDCIIVDNNDISNDVIISDNTEKKEEKEKNGSESAQTAQHSKTAELSDIFINDMETIESGKIIANLGKKSGKNAIFELDFVMESFKDLVKTWLDYKKSRGQTYKSEKYIEIFYKKLIQFSGGDLKIATEIVEQSIANNWAGIFELKNNQQNGTTQRHYTKSAAELKAERDREFEARIYAKLASGNNGASADDSLPF